MTLLQWLLTWAVAAAAFVVLDLLWLGVIAGGTYRRILGELLREQANVPAAIAFYVLFLALLCWFAVRPGIDGGLGEAALNGALFGLATYATWDLTNLAVLRGFPAAIVPIDIAWGTILCASIATAATWAARSWFA
jgi:uncharacterized membrane protein